MSRQELLIWLENNDVEHSRTATIAQLKRLRQAEIERLNMADDRPDSPKLSEHSGNSTEIPNPAHANLLQEEAKLDVELRILEKRHQIAVLRAELALEQNIPNEGNCEPTFKDIRHSVFEFSGGEEYDANKWLADFERACDSVDGNLNFRLKCIRRLMKSDSEAELFLRTDSSVTYDEFRANFLANFGHMYTVSDILEKMKKTIYVPGKMSVMGYIL